MPKLLPPYYQPLECCHSTLHCYPNTELELACVKGGRDGSATFLTDPRTSLVHDWGDADAAYCGASSPACRGLHLSPGWAHNNSIVGPYSGSVSECRFGGISVSSNRTKAVNDARGLIPMQTGMRSFMLRTDSNNS